MTSIPRVTVLAAGLLAAGLASAASPVAPPPELLIPGVGVFPESITSSKDGTIYVGSPGARAIFRAKPGAATAELWIQPGTDGMQSMFGVFADDSTQTLWACSNGLGGPPGSPPSKPAALYAFSLADGKSKGHYPLPTAGAMCNDIAIGRDGSVYATDTANMEVVRLKPDEKSPQVWSKPQAYGPKGGVLDGISVLGNDVYVNTLATSKMFKTPIGAHGDAGATVEIKLDRPIERPDGMRSFGKDSVLVTEGGGGGRLSQIKFSGDAGAVTTLKEGFPDGPVAVTVVDTTAYVLEGQLMAMMRPDPAAKPKPFRAHAVPLGAP